MRVPRLASLVVLVGVVVGLVASAGPGAWAADKAKKAPPPPPWSTFSAGDGSYAWAEPTGWALDEAHSQGGVRMVWNEPGDAGGVFTIAAYAKTKASLEELVKAASYGAKPRAHKAWMCALGALGDDKVAVAARTLENGDYLLLVLSAKAPVFNRLGGLPGLRKAANAVYGFKATSTEAMPGE